MSYRGIYKDGVIHVPSGTPLREGDRVDVTIARTKSAKTPKKSRPLPGFGAWRNRRDIKDSAAFVRGLRSGVFRRRKGG